jgi:hypothetical protein
MNFIIILILPVFGAILSIVPFLFSVLIAQIAELFQ